MANLEDQEDFNQLWDNLCDEMGLNKGSTIPHSLLYLNMMKKLNVNLTTPMQTETLQLIDVMLFYCRHPDPVYGVTAICLGSEAIVPELYSHIVQGFNACHINGNDLEFFNIHIKYDDKHAEILSHILQKIIIKNPNKSIIINQVAHNMLKHRIRFLDALLG